MLPYLMQPTLLSLSWCCLLVYQLLALLYPLRPLPAKMSVTYQPVKHSGHLRPTPIIHSPILHPSQPRLPQRSINNRSRNPSPTTANNRLIPLHPHP